MSPHISGCHGVRLPVDSLASVRQAADSDGAGGRVGSAAAAEAQGWGAGVISPELLPREGRGRPQELLPVALEPPPDNSLVQTLYEGGRRDARAWLALHSATAS